MALFSKKSNKDSKETAKKKVDSGARKKKTVKKTGNPVRSFDYQIIIHPRITEKATDVSEDHNVYTFDVHPRATKNEIAKEVKRLYKVEPLKVRTLRVPHSLSSVRGRKFIRHGGKKAYVYLKEGDSIEIV